MHKKMQPALFVVVLYFLGVYTNLPLSLGKTQFPMFSVVPGYLMGLWYFWNRLLTRQTVAAGLFAGLCFSLSILAPALHEMLTTHLIGAGQLMFSLLMGLMAYWIITTYDRTQIARFSLIAAVIILFLSVVEIATPLRSAVKSYSLLYGTQGITDEVINRDIGQSGGYRPKLFTSETSYVAMAVSYILAVYVWTSPSPRKYLIGCGLLVSGLIILRSPTILGSGIAISVCFMLELVRSKRLRITSSWVFPLMLVMIAFVGLIAWDYLAFLFGQRVANVANGSDYSVTYRTYGSIASGLAVARAYPLFGVGLGAYDLVASIIINTEIQLGVPLQAIAVEWRSSLNNAPSNSLVVFGFLGSAIIWALAIGFIRRLANGITPVLFTLWLVLGLSDGAIYSPRYVIYVFIFAGVARVMEQGKRSDAGITVPKIRLSRTFVAR
jgi:hypothetical protein